MDPRTAVVLVGLSHRTTPVSVRERYVVKQEDLAQTLRTLHATPGVHEAFVLSTCNRTEVVVVGEHDAELATPVRAHVFRNLAEQHLYSFAGVQALIHFFRVAAGLDSLVVGESEILGQIKKSFDAARDAKTLGPTLQALVQQALHVGKRVRTETPVGQGTLSVARVGVDVAARVFGSFTQCDALVVGAGETGMLVARHLRDQGVRSLAFANRTRERAQQAATELGGRAWAIDELAQATRAADLVVACVEGNEFAVSAAHFDAKHVRRRDRPMLVVDLSIPRAVDPALARLSNLLLYDLDDLARVVHDNERDRRVAVEGTSEILVTELHKFLSGRAYAAFGPVIAAMRERFEAVRDETLDHVAGAKSEPRDVELAHELTKRLLDAALHHVKDGVRSSRTEESLDREYRRFLEHLR